MGKLDGKVAIVTGAAMGMGAAEAEILAQEGATVIVADIDEKDGAAVAKKVGGTFLGIRAVAESMKAAGGGVIVNISSTAGLTAYSGMSAYVASKWGVRGLTKAAALELGHDNIRVVSVHPGGIRTPMTAGMDSDAMFASQPIPRIGEPEEVAKMVLFLVADATFSTGTEFIVDGGVTVGQIMEY